MLLPAPPGAGKSTLCAGLVHRGWRLLSDELALVDMETGLVRGMARPVNLKNKSIEVIRDFAPEIAARIAPGLNSFSSIFLSLKIRFIKSFVSVES